MSEKPVLGYLYIISIVPSATIEAEEIQSVMDRALDWFRINLTTWVVYSTSPAPIWFARLQSKVKPDGQVFICRLDSDDHQGWMTQKFWDWFNACLARATDKAAKKA